MNETTLIANGTIVTAEGEFAGDVLIDGEAIAAVGRVDAPDGATVIDVPTAMIFAQSDPPISHASIENSSRAALDVAIDAYGRTVEQALVAVVDLTRERSQP